MMVGGLLFQTKISSRPVLSTIRTKAVQIAMRRISLSAMIPILIWFQHWLKPQFQITQRFWTPHSRLTVNYAVLAKVELILQLNFG